MNFIPTAPGSPDPVAELLDRRLDSLIHQVAIGERYYQDIANAARHVAADYHGRFLIELIQNANDQAIRGGLPGTVISVVRGEGLLAVGNGGEPFDARGLDRITSLFRSDKRVGSCLGNKGVGFKAVFEVADAVEIYSCRPGGHLAEAAGRLAFRLERQPLEDAGFEAYLRSECRNLLDRHPDRQDAIRLRFPGECPADAVLREARRAAGFTFPLRLDGQHLHVRTAALGLQEDLLGRMQTLVVLLLKRNDPVRQSVDAAIDEILGENTRPGACFLFLPGITGLRIVDHIRRWRAELSRVDMAGVQDLGHRVRLRRRQTVCRQQKDADGDASIRSQDWWVAETMLGDARRNDERTLAERVAIRDAVAALDLPEENWGDIQEVPVAVALPGSDRREDPPGPLGPDGRFCIGLPTHVATGLPFWASSHFHGHINRREISFDHVYNGLLFRAIVELAETLLDHLKLAPLPATRRLVTLAMERHEGKMADAFYADDGLARKEVVLAADGRFVKPSDLRLPAPDDVPMLERLSEGIGSLNTYGFGLPDPVLLVKAREVLDGLPGIYVVPPAQYLRRPDDQLSLLEYAARHHRDQGPAFWERFLEWVLDRFASSPPDRQQLTGQRILPVGTDGLASPDARVFFPPAEAVHEAQAPESAGDDADEMSSLDASITALLNLFDARAIQVRSGRGRDYTPLAQRLAADAGGLVRRPRQADLINEALIPALCRSAGRRRRALTLLHQALLWLEALPAKSRRFVHGEKLRVPVRARDKRWEWVEPDKAYVGQGWDSDPAVQLLGKAYGARPASLLVDWDRFARTARPLLGKADRAWWLRRLKDIGVCDGPRVIEAERSPVVAQSDSYEGLTPLFHASCPVPCPQDIWQSYLEHICQREASTCSGQVFVLEGACWIDGLETDEIRAQVVEAMLSRPDRYQHHLRATLARQNGSDSTETLSLWLYALQTRQWSVVPTPAGLRTPGQAWLVPAQQRSLSGRRYESLAPIAPAFAGAEELLRAMGVCRIDDAPISKLAAGLQEIAAGLENTDSPTTGEIAPLVIDLYEAIETRLAAGAPAGDLKCLLESAVPLIRGQRMGRVVLNQVDCLAINDDDVRCRHIRRLHQCWVVPKRFDQRYDHLVEGLRGLLGERVVLVSQCPLDISFTRSVEGMPLLEWLRQEYPDRPVAVDLGLLLVKGGSPARTPHEDAFDHAWRRISQVRVLRGRFAGESPPSACFDGSDPDGPTLMVNTELASHEVVGHLWQLFGAAYLNTWDAYAQALGSGRTDPFFEKRFVPPADRAEVESVIGLGFEQRLKRYQPICLAVWRQGNPERSPSEFHTQWTGRVASPAAAAEWLAWPTLATDLALATCEQEPEGSLLLLRKTGLCVRRWQEARQELGLPPWRFVASEQLYAAARRAIVGHLMAWFARLIVPRSSPRAETALPFRAGEAVIEWRRRFHDLHVPGEIAEEPATCSTIIAHAARDALRVWHEQSLPPDLLAVFVRPLEDLAESAPGAIESIRLRDEPDKAAILYESTDQDMRQGQSGAAVEALLKVAVALAAKAGESLDEKVVRQDERVVLLATGFWANPVSVLAAVQYALQRVVPATAVRMKERRVFTQPDDWRRLWLGFEELGPVPAGGVPVVPPPKFDVLGAGWTQQELCDAAASGPGGPLLQRLQLAVDPDLDFAALLDRPRQPARVRARHSGRAGGGGGRTRRVPDEHARMLGALGEHFVYEQLTVLCPGFDITNWRSTGKDVFGYGVGDDSLGYDFEYFDGHRKLVHGNNSPRCLIEVKSATGDGGDTFEMTLNEWEVAQRCHDGRENGTYMIIRVAGLESTPRIADLLVDPVDLQRQGLLNYGSRSLLVVVGCAAGG